MPKNKVNTHCSICLTSRTAAESFSGVKKLSCATCQKITDHYQYYTDEHAYLSQTLGKYLSAYRQLGYKIDPTKTGEPTLWPNQKIIHIPNNKPLKDRIYMLQLFWEIANPIHPLPLDVRTCWTLTPQNQPTLKRK